MSNKKVKINIPKKKAKEMSLKDQRKLLFHASFSDYRFLRKEIKAFFRLIEVIDNSLPDGWTYSYPVGSARTLTFTKKGLLYNPETNSIKNFQMNEIRQVANIVSMHFSYYVDRMPVYNEDGSFSHMQIDARREILQHNGRRKVIRVRFKYLS